MKLTASPSRPSSWFGVALASHIALRRQLCPLDPVIWPMYFSMYLYIVALGGSEEVERDLPEEDLPLSTVVGKFTENGIFTAISVLKSGTGITRSIVNAMATKWLFKGYDIF